jgi:hypothetical protein
MIRPNLVATSSYLISFWYGEGARQKSGQLRGHGVGRVSRCSGAEEAIEPGTLRPTSTARGL